MFYVLYILHFKLRLNVTFGFVIHFFLPFSFLPNSFTGWDKVCLFLSLSFVLCVLDVFFSFPPPPFIMFYFINIKSHKR